jgi:predicted nucleic acid-binding protein
LARLILLDASVAIAALAVDDAHHAVAARALSVAADDELVVAATTRAEILIGPYRAGGTALEHALGFVDGCATVPVTVPIADDAAALRAHHPGLSLPDATALVVALLIDADLIWTFDRRWSTVDARAGTP